MLLDSSFASLSWPAALAISAIAISIAAVLVVFIWRALD